MKIGVIGIGGIAQKAYLPTYAKMRKEASFIFATVMMKQGIRFLANTISLIRLQRLMNCWLRKSTPVSSMLLQRSILRSLSNV